MIVYSTLSIGSELLKAVKTKLFIVRELHEMSTIMIVYLPHKGRVVRVVEELG